jgi:hypothetical protein
MIEEGMGSPDPEERAITLLVTELRGTPRISARTNGGG